MNSSDSMTVIHGDCQAVLREIPTASIDAVVTDPPYGLSFMGRKWDYDVPSVEVWAECLRVLKPGGHLLAFAGTRTQHRMCCRIEDAGFEIRDMIAWVYGSGFPKSLDVGKAIDKAAGAEREKVLVPTKPGNTRGERGISYAGESFSGFTDISEPATAAAKKWHGWGTALKPAMEPITVARKPLDGTVAENVQEWGTGAINVEGCRVPGNDHASAWDRPVSTNIGAGSYISDGTQHVIDISANKPSGRWPANLIHDGSEEPTALLGEAARFFYCPKASKSERGEGNNHPTVKPTDLMRYLCRLVTPPGGVVLDPFTGSGSTGKAAVLEGFQFIGIEREAEYVEIARARIIGTLRVPQPRETNEPTELL